MFFSKFPQSASPGNKSRADTKRGPPAFSESGALSGGDIFDSHGRGHVAPDAAIASLELRKAKALWRRGKNALFSSVANAVGVWFLGEINGRGDLGAT